MVEREALAYHLIKTYPKTPSITLLVVLCRQSPFVDQFLTDLRRYVDRTACNRHQVIGLAEVLTPAEIDHFHDIHLVLIVEHEVLRLDVPMSYRPRMLIVHRIKHLVKYVLCFFFIKPSLS